jgi:hypothetical protein
MKTNTLSKLALGRLILAALVAVTSKLTKPARDAFAKAFRALFEADSAVQTADRHVVEATQRCDAADEGLKGAVLDLATKMAGDGFGRFNPFKAFDVANPSTVVRFGHANEANTLLAMAARVMVHPNSGPATQKAAATVERAANALLAAERDRVTALKQRADAVDFRDHDLPEAYALALKNLRSAIAFADYTEGTANYRNVFQTPKRTKKAPAPVSTEPAK